MKQDDVVKIVADVIQHLSGPLKDDQAEKIAEGYIENYFENKEQKKNIQKIVGKWNDHKKDCLEAWWEGVWYHEDENKKEDLQIIYLEDFEKWYDENHKEFANGTC